MSTTDEQMASTPQLLKVEIHGDRIWLRLGNGLIGLSLTETKSLQVLLSEGVKKLERYEEELHAMNVTRIKNGAL